MAMDPDNPYRFSDWLRQHQAGTLDLELGDSLRQLVECVGHLEKSGTVTVKVKVDTQGSAFVVGAEVNVALPKEKPTSSIYFAGADGRLTKNHPDQPSLPLEAS